MPVEVLLTGKLQVTWHTRVWFVNLVNKLVTLQFVLPHKALAAMLTNVGALSGVYESVSGEFILVGVGLAANNALERPLTCMDACMNN